MEQGNRLDSTPVSAAQAIRDDMDMDYTLGAAVAHLLTAPSTKTAVAAPDPILAAIAETRQLTLARTAAMNLPQPAGSIAPSPEEDAAARAFFSHVDDVLLKTVPATGAGCVALARYAVEFLEAEGFALDENEANDQHVRILDLIARSPLVVPAVGHAEDHDLLLLGVQFDAAHEVWARAVEANREPSARHAAFLATAEARGALTMKDHTAAEDLPGVREAGRAEDETFSVVVELALKALRMPAHSVEGLAVQARSLIPNVWATGSYEQEAALGDEEDIHREAVRLLISHCCIAAGVDWKGRPLTSASSLPAVLSSASDIANTCVAQVHHLDWWDKNPGAFSEDEATVEMDRWRAVFRRAINEPSANSHDLAGKAFLMLADLDRFMPEDGEGYDTDNYRLMRVIMREAIVMGGLTYPAAAQDRAGAEHCHRDATRVAPVAAVLDVDLHDRAFHAASTELRLAARDHKRLVNPADGVWVELNGGDTSAEAMAPAVVARDAAAAREDQAWRDLFKIRPRTNHQMWLLLRDVAEHFDAHQGMEDEPDVFGALIGTADGLRSTAPELVAPHDLTRLSIVQLEDLAGICSRQAMAMLNAGRGAPEGSLRGVLEDEQHRIGRLGNMATSEIERRVPADVDERDLRLETLIRAELAGNGYIEPKLLAEAVEAWGAR